MSAHLRILIVGGYGTFGGRIVELLENEERLTLIVAGRSLGKATDFCRNRRGVKAQIVAAQFDRNADAGMQLAALKPDVLVDASGPFQAYGERRYCLIEAAIAQRVNYLDLADGSDFVEGVPLSTRRREAPEFLFCPASPVFLFSRRRSCAACRSTWRVWTASAGASRRRPMPGLAKM
jgi:saccharopine dehydrogenase-like NADP-dependent oxidoreductase